MKDDEKLIILTGGGDWADASVNLIILNKEIDLRLEKKKWNEWYKTEYSGHSKEVRYISFENWLKDRCGARDEDEPNIEYFYDD